MCTKTISPHTLHHACNIHPGCSACGMKSQVAGMAGMRESGHHTTGIWHCKDTMLQGYYTAGIRHHRVTWLPLHMVWVTGGRTVAKLNGWNTYTVSLSFYNAAPSLTHCPHSDCCTPGECVFTSHGEEKMHALFVCAPLMGCAPWCLARWPSVSTPPSSVVVSMFVA